MSLSEGSFKTYKPERSPPSSMATLYRTNDFASICYDSSLRDDVARESLDYQHLLLAFSDS